MTMEHAKENDRLWEFFHQEKSRQTTTIPDLLFSREDALT